MRERATWPSSHVFASLPWPWRNGRGPKAPPSDWGSWWSLVGPPSGGAGRTGGSGTGGEGPGGGVKPRERGGGAPAPRGRRRCGRARRDPKPQRGGGSPQCVTLEATDMRRPQKVQTFERGGGGGGGGTRLVSRGDGGAGPVADRSGSRERQGPCTLRKRRATRGGAGGGSGARRPGSAPASDRDGV